MPSPLRRVVAVVALVAGSSFAADPPAPPVGTVSGRIVWAGKIPAVPQLDSVMAGVTTPNPHAPHVASDNRGLAGVVVSLRGVGSVGTWNHPPVRVEMSAEHIRVVQGDSPRPVGFVKRGDSVTMRSSTPGPLMLRARGAAFFTLAFPQPDQPLTRKFDQPGVVELSSGSGQFWAAADLFVCNHPYYAVTGPDGLFTLSDVPVGEYEVVAWKRNWHIATKERDPESGLVVRLKNAAPVEKRAVVSVRPGETAVDLTYSGADFQR